MEAAKRKLLRFTVVPAYCTFPLHMAKSMMQMFLVTLSELPHEIIDSFVWSSLSPRLLVGESYEMLSAVHCMKHQTEFDASKGVG